MAPLPLAALRIEPAIIVSMESVGLRMVGTVMAAPRAPLVRRFGKGLLLRLDQALGRIEEALSPRLPVAAAFGRAASGRAVILTEDIEQPDG